MKACWFHAVIDYQSDIHRTATGLAIITCILINEMNLIGATCTVSEQKYGPAPCFRL